MGYFIAFLVIAAVFYMVGNDKTSSTKRCLVFSSIFLFVLSAFRAISIGSDTRRYSYLFRYANELSFSQIFEEFQQEPLYFLLCKIVGFLCNGNFQFMIAFVALLYITSLYVFLDKFSSNSFISFVMLLSLGLFYFSISAMRQTIAISLLLFSYHFVMKRKFVPFALLVALATLSHNSAIVFLLVYFFKNIKIGAKQVFAVITSVFLSFIMGDKIINALFFLSGNDLGDRNIKTLTWMGFIIQFSIMAFAMLFYERTVINNKNNICLYNTMFIGLCIQAFAVNFAEMFRLSMYFSIFNIALIPNAMDSIKDNRMKKLVEILVVLVFLSYYFLFNWNDELIIPYKFFWQT